MAEAKKKEPKRRPDVLGLMLVATLMMFLFSDTLGHHPLLFAGSGFLLVLLALAWIIYKEEES